MSWTRLLAFDPGGTSGIAMRLANGEIVTSTTGTPEELYELIKSSKELVDHIIYEGYGAESITKYGLYTVRLVGAIHGICSVLDIPCTQHMPSYRRPFISDAKEILSGRKHVKHEVDALAHLLRYEYDRTLA